MPQFFPPRLAGDEPEKNKAKKTLCGPIYDTYSFTNKGKVKKYRFQSVSRRLMNLFGEKTIKIVWRILSANSNIFSFRNDDTFTVH